MIATFYSFKGGVGRSMALVNVAELLANQGYHVLLCDWDLEAPGLENFLVDAGDPQAPAEVIRLRESLGIIDLLEEYKRELASDVELTEDQIDPAVFQRVGDAWLRRPSTAALEVRSRTTRSGSIRLLNAGRRQGAYESYTQAIRAFSWADFYDNWAGAAYFEFFRKDLSRTADIVLIDSRTGVTEQGGVCTHHLADLVVLLSAPNDLNVEGSKWMAQRLARPGLVQDRGGRPLALLPVAARVEVSGETDLLAEFRAHFDSEFEPFVSGPLKGEPELFKRTRIPYVSKYSLKERIVAREHPKGSLELYDAYVAITSAIVKHGLESGLLASRDGAVTRRTEEAERALRDYAAPGGTFVLSHSQADRELAQLVAQGLASVGVIVRSDVAGQSSGAMPSPIDESLAGAAGWILFVGPGGVDERLTAELDFVLRQVALGRDLRVIPMVTAGVDPKSLPGSLIDIRCVQLPSDLERTTADDFRRIATELPANRGRPRLDVAAGPYPGLRAYDESEARVFIGRDRPLAEMLDRLGPTRTGHSHVLQIEGPAGSGKTSLVRAGLIPAVKRGRIPRTPEHWHTVFVRPSVDGVESLTAALRTSEGSAGRLSGSFGDSLSRLSLSPGALRDYARDVVAGGRGFLLVVDQLDDLFTLESTTRADIEQFDQLLATCCDVGDEPIYVVTTLCSDFASASLAKLPRLSAMIAAKGSRYQLGPLGKDELLEVITRGVRLAGRDFEPGLAQRMVDDIAQVGASPSLVQMVVSTLLERAAGPLVTHAAYTAYATPRKLLSDMLEESLRALSAADQQRTRAVVLSLLTATGVRRVAEREDVVAVAGGDAEAERLVDALVRTRLLTSVEPARLELTYDWTATDSPTVAAWLNQDREALRRRDEVDRAAADWEARGRSVDALPGGQRLAEYERAAQTRKAREFVAAARVQSNRMRARMRIVGGIAALVLLTAITIAWASARRADQFATAARLAGDSAQRQVQQDSAVRRADSLRAQSQAATAALTDSLAATRLRATQAQFRADSLALVARQARTEGQRAAEKAAAAQTDSLLRSLRTVQSARLQESRRADSLATRSDSLQRRVTQLERELASYRGKKP